MADTSSGVLQRNPALDGVRGVAVLLVLANHFLAAGDPNRGLIAAPFKVAIAGWIGVDLFFVLSGYLITSILWRTREEPNYFSSFYARRVLRIFPLYYGCLIVALLVLPRFDFFRTAETAAVLDRQTYVWLYAANFSLESLSRGWLNMGHLWSLAIEEQFYLVWPLVIRAASRKTCVRIAAGAIVVSVLSRSALQYVGAVNPDLAVWSAKASFLWTFCRLDGLAAGCLIALWSTNREDRLRLERFALPAGIVSGAFMLWWLWKGMFGRMLAADGSSTTAAMRIGGFLCVALAFGAIVVLATRDRSGWPARFFGARPLQSMGKYSYGIYMFQGFLAPAFHRWWPVENLQRAAGPDGGAYLFFLLSTVATIAVAVVSSHLYETPFLRLKDRFEIAPERMPVP